MKKHMILSAMFVVVVILGGYVYGFRMSGIEAAKAHFAVGQNARYIDEVAYDWGRVYLWNTDEGPRTVISKRYLFLWRAGNAVHIKVGSDQIQTLGWVNDLHCTVYAVNILDENVSYIEMGEGENRQKHYKKENNQILFAWDYSVPWQDLKGIAYGRQGEILYEFRYPQDSNKIALDDIRWFAK